MSSNVAEVIVRVRADTRSAQTGMANAAGSVESSTSRMKSTLKAVGGAIVAAFAVEKVVAFTKECITAASDLNETISKTNQIFGSSAKAILDWSKGSAEAVGMSQTAALDAADTFAIFGKAAGLTGGDLTQFSTKLVGTAADFASFANTTPDEAIQAIGAALRGETEPIRKYGLMLNDASIKQEAVRQGLIKTVKDAINPAQKALAVNGLIEAFSKSQKIAGDFQRTSGGLANQQRILAARADNLKATIGQALLPAMIKVVSIALKMIGAFTNLAKWIKNNADVIVPLAAVVATLTLVMSANAIATAAISTAQKIWAATTKAVAIAQRLLSVALATSPIGLIIIGIVALAAALVIAYKKSATFRAIVQGAFRAVTAAAKALWNAIKVAFTGIKRVIQSVMDWLLHSKIAAVLLGPWRIAFGALRALVKGGISGLLGYFRGLLAALGNIVSRVFAIITTPFHRAFEWTRDHVIRPLGEAFGNVAGFIGRALSGVFNAITAPFRQAWEWILDHIIGPLKSTWNGVAGVINGIHFSITVPSNALTKFAHIAGKGFTFDPPNIPTLARGAFVDSASLAVVGEAGAEWVLPDGKLRALLRDELGGAGVTIVVNGALDPDAVARQIDRLLTARHRRVNGPQRHGGIPATA